MRLNIRLIIIVILFISSIFLFLDVIYIIQKNHTLQIRALTLSEDIDFSISYNNLYLRIVLLILFITILTGLAIIHTQKRKEPNWNSITHTLDLMADNIKSRDNTIDTLKRLSINILKSLPLGVVIIDKDKNIVLKNDVIMGLKIIKSKESNVIDGLFISSVERLINESYSNNKTIQGTIIKIDDSYYRISTAFFKEKDSEWLHMIIILNDITLEKRFEERIFTQERLASLSMLSAGLAHEINNPLAIAYSTVNYLLEESYEFKDDLIMIKQQLERCKNVISNFRSLVRSERDFECLEVSMIIREVISLLSSKLKDIRVNIYSKRAHFIRGRIELLKQAFINILLNSVDAINKKDGMIDIHIYNKGDYIAIDFIDNGEGFNKEDDLNKVLKPFYTTKGNKGTGLGLFIVKTIIENHDGSIYIKNREDKKGAVVSVHIPGESI